MAAREFLGDRAARGEIGPTTEGGQVGERLGMTPGDSNLGTNHENREHDGKHPEQADREHRHGTRLMMTVPRPAAPRRSV